MRAAILSIGDELLLGEVVDTNAATIAARLYNLGVNLPLQMTVGDSMQDIVDACQLLAGKSDTVIVTGGLGPTVDDVTAMAAAKLAGSPLEPNLEAMAHLKNFAEKVAEKLHPANDKQALMPVSAKVIPNPVGTACGFSLVHEGCRFFFLPGVPGEMVSMLDETVLPALASSGRLRTLRTKTFKVSGVSEAELDVMLQGMTEGFAAASIAFCVNFPEIEVKIRVVADEELTADEIIAIVGDKTRNILAAAFLPRMVKPSTRWWPVFSKKQELPCPWPNPALAASLPNALPIFPEVRHIFSKVLLLTATGPKSICWAFPRNFWKKKVQSVPRWQWQWLVEQGKNPAVILLLPLPVSRVPRGAQRKSPSARCSWHLPARSNAGSGFLIFMVTGSRFAWSPRLPPLTGCEGSCSPGHNKQQYAAR